ncbi:MAG: Response regulator receiver [Parcubacteria group bacterium GW2011_GWB1_56_8]|nr:MAG: Response regulator receiver [Parcubacteria group bacterium GW2011_GWB1_56_8]
MKSIVLLVDDDRESQIAVRECLNLYGFAVSIADNGREALNWLECFTPDVILLDLRMPVMSGEEFLLAYKGNAPVIVTSACSDPELPKPVAAVVLKPFFMSEMDKIIRAVIGKEKPCEAVPWSRN